jgi:hypothetical protein
MDKDLTANSSKSATELPILAVLGSSSADAKIGLQLLLSIYASREDFRSTTNAFSPT